VHWIRLTQDWDEWRILANMRISIELVFSEDWVCAVQWA